MEFSEGCLKLLQQVHCFKRETGQHGRCVPFIVAGEQVGLVPEKVVAELIHYPDVFNLEMNSPGGVGCVQLNASLHDYKRRSDAVHTVLRDLRKKKLFVTLDGWRDECYDVCGKSKKALLKMERAGTPLFGTKQHGVHINGYTRHPTKGLCMWIAKRSMTKQTYPGKLDQMVAGGLTNGLGILECAVKESKEEASVPDDILEGLVSVSCISYFNENERGLSPETEYIFDLEVPLDFTPVNADGEAESFQLLTMGEVKDIVLTDVFKSNCAVVIIDFMIRHGIITPDSDPNYVKLLTGLRTPHPY